MALIAFFFFPPYWCSNYYGKYTDGLMLGLVSYDSGVRSDINMIWLTLLMWDSEELGTMQSVTYLRLV